MPSIWFIRCFRLYGHYSFARYTSLSNKEELTTGWKERECIWTFSVVEKNDLYLPCPRQLRGSDVLVSPQISNSIILLLYHLSLHLFHKLVSTCSKHTSSCSTNIIQPAFHIYFHLLHTYNSAYSMIQPAFHIYVHLLHTYNSTFSTHVSTCSAHMTTCFSHISSPTPHI